MKIWTTTVDDGNEIVTMAYPTAEKAYDALQVNYASDCDFDLDTVDGRAEMIYWLTEREGIVLYIDEHELEVQA